MKFVIESPTTSIANFFRRAGYHFQKRESEEMAFVKKFTDQEFPRFHAFAKTVDYKFHVNIHIDHKRTSYEGSRAHSGEYGENSKLLQEEVERLQKIT